MNLTVLSLFITTIFQANIEDTLLTKFGDKRYFKCNNEGCSINLTNEAKDGFHKFTIKDTLLATAHIIKGKLEGEWKWYSMKTGKIEEVNTYKSGELDGKQFKYENGKLKSFSTVVNNKYEGESVIYNADGSILSISYYKEDTLYSTYLIDENGNPIIECYPKNTNYKKLTTFPNCSVLFKLNGSIQNSDDVSITVSSFKKSWRIKLLNNQFQLPDEIGISPITNVEIHLRDYSFSFPSTIFNKFDNGIAQKRIQSLIRNIELSITLFNNKKPKGKKAEATFNGNYRALFND